MRIFFDTEFIEDGRIIELLSIGMVRDDGAELYLEAGWTDQSKANPWVRENVLPLLNPRYQVSRETMRKQIVEFAGEAPEFWAYYAAYDWVALCQLFGPMVALPRGWPMWCRDFKQLLADRGRPLVDTTCYTHNALEDARWLAETFDRLG